MQGSLVGVSVLGGGASDLTVNCFTMYPELVCGGVISSPIRVLRAFANCSTARSMASLLGDGLSL